MKKLVLWIVLLAGVFFSAIVAGKRLGKNIQKSPPEAAPAAPAKGDLGYQESETTVAVGTADVQSGNFDRVEAGELYFTADGIQTRLPLPDDEAIIACTRQDLAQIRELDFDQVGAVLQVLPGAIAEKIPVGTAVVVLSDESRGTRTAHTIAVSDSAICAK